ncbi:glycine-rich domain-containing protein-like [Trichocoleus sp. FACHB-262]|uniref:glycine-rich domain-containing protein n=1 Tax=Trichocoleus sp. FACHB-262 TaxID=2692869 RepID=UPI0016897E7F|nr:glycine-rich domain-containing protein-like [Trichocoleus sp. FACHB-262]MBD2121481.1 glycine-rich domain-containing protein-like [Trichocoleus sp. FACHB-262]
MVQYPASPQSYQAFLQKVRSLDLGPIAHQLMHSQIGPQWTKLQATRAIARYLGFLYLVGQYPRLQLVPTQEIDQVWHQHILDTHKYAEDCQHLFGRFIHHFPYLGTRGEADQQDWQRAYALTQVLFRKHFGLDLATAAAPSDCEPLHTMQTCRGVDRSSTQSRPTVSLSMEDALRSFFTPA